MSPSFRKNHDERSVPLTTELGTLLTEYKKHATSERWVFTNGDGKPESHFFEEIQGDRRGCRPSLDRSRSPGPNRETTASSGRIAKSRHWSPSNLHRISLSISASMSARFRPPVILRSIFPSGVITNVVGKPKSPPNFVV